MKTNVIYNEDCMGENGMCILPDNSVDMVLTDPPYGISRESGYTNTSLEKYKDHEIDFGEWDKKDVDLCVLAKEFYRILKESGVAVVFYDIWDTTTLKTAFDDFNQHRVLVWIKNNPVPINTRVNFLSNAKEFGFSCVKGGTPTFDGHYHNGVFEYPICHGNERTDHPTQKPKALFDDLIELYTEKGDVVFDGFMGSGTTAISCISSDREYIGFERDEEYYELARERIKIERDQGKLF